MIVRNTCRLRSGVDEQARISAQTNPTALRKHGDGLSLCAACRAYGKASLNEGLHRAEQARSSSGPKLVLAQPPDGRRLTSRCFCGALIEGDGEMRMYVLPSVRARAPREVSDSTRIITYVIKAQG